MPAPSKLSRLDEAILPHFGCGYNLAHWLMRKDNDAEDAVQHACLRAIRFIPARRRRRARVVAD